MTGVASACLIFLLLTGGLSLQAASLDNAGVVKMVRAGLSEEIVLAAVNSEEGRYSLSPDDIISLKQEKVPDNVIAAMLKRNGVSAAPPETTAPVAEIGVYYQKSGAWADLKAEVVNWKTGGVVKHVGSLGVVKGDLNGLVSHPHSPNELATPIEILVYTLEGEGASEYQLVRLHEHSNDREFRTVTGGVFHVSEGAMKDLVSFDSRKTGPRLYRITLSNLKPGEYGFLPPMVADLSNHAAAAIGKIYTFRVLE